MIKLKKVPFPISLREDLIDKVCKDAMQKHNGNRSETVSVILEKHYKKK